MDTSLPNSAALLVNQLPVEALAQLFQQFAEEPRSDYLAKRLVSARPIRSTFDLASLMPHPDVKRRVFQALRIAVNDELGSLSRVLPDCLHVLCPAGRLAVITFHSLEDRIVKQEFKSWQDHKLGFIVTRTPIVPEVSEITINPKSKSAKLRVFEKI